MSSSPPAFHLPDTNQDRADGARADLWLTTGLKLQQLARRRGFLAALIAAGVARIVDEFLTADDHTEDGSTDAGRRRS